jgi:hypothetical protein
MIMPGNVIGLKIGLKLKSLPHPSMDLAQEMWPKDNKSKRDP